ncbi:tetratricopeptide repeat protein [Desertibaculum subflavum]|uniref:tetratricopeptide repeat protein n=1 Tax=Desertibaculum subflavum TaxID=2268458 RepID=UPI0013C4E534
MIAARTPPVAGEARWLLALKTLRAAMVETAAVLIGLSLVVLLVWEAMRDRVVIEPLSVPRELAEAGFTGDVIAQRMVAHITEIQTTAQTGMQWSSIALAAHDQDVPIAAAGGQISPRALAVQLRNAACWLSNWACRQQLRFGGDVTRLPDGFRIEMRLLGAERLTHPSGPGAPAELSDVGRIVSEAAEAVVWKTNPYFLASFAYRSDKPAAERLAHLILRDEPLGSPASLRAINLIGLIRHHAGDLDGAEANFRRAIALDRNFEVAHMNLGTVLYDRGTLDAAIASHRRAIAIDPKYARAHGNLGRALHAKRDLAGAISSYRRALELDPRIAILHSNLAVALMDRGDLAEAVATCRRAIELDPDYAPAQYNLGLALRRGGDIDGAIAAYQKATALGLDRSFVRDELASALAERDGAARRRTP